MKNNEAKALDVLSDQIIKAIQKICSRLDFDRTHIGIISKINAGICTVKYNGTEINIKTDRADAFKRNDIVKICIPCGNRRYAFIVNEPLSARSTEYDNSKSGLQAKNINDAIDELYRMINEVKTASVSVSEDMIADE